MSPTSATPSPADNRSEPAALSQLRQAIRSFVFRRVKDPALADDITQETFLRLHQRFATLRDTDRLQAWVFQVARNAVADHFRAAKPTEPFDESTHSSVPELRVHEPMAAEEEVLRRDLAAYIRSVVDSLPEIYREALRLAELDGIPQVELARRLGLSISAVKSRVQRARLLVREEMERCCRWETDRYGTIVDVQPKAADCCDSDPCARESASTRICST